METLLVPSLIHDGIRYDFPSDFVIAALPKLWDDGRNHQICCIDVPGSRRALRRDEYGSMIASADLVLPTSAQLLRQLASDSEGMTRTLPVPFQHQLLLDAQAEIMDYRPSDTPELRTYQPLKVLTLLLTATERFGGSAFLVGGDARTLARAEANIRSTYPGLSIVGRMPGTYTGDEEAGLVLALQKSSPVLILTGSGIPQGELWIPRHMSSMRTGIFFHLQDLLERLAGSGRSQ
ncbi:MAG: WecB/TagA/CpsF family glycosyltransferase [Rectinemataceae bacterium]